VDSVGQSELPIERRSRETHRHRRSDEFAPLPRSEGEVDPSDRDNSPGPPKAGPWIRSHAGMMSYLKSRKYPADVRDRLRDIAEFPRPDLERKWKQARS
jgi:hypothetical protein